MKKLFLFLAAAIMTVAGYAAGTGDGSSQANAIEFDWEAGNTQVAGTSLWYRVSLESLYGEEEPMLALYLTNLSYNSADVTVSAVVAGSEEVRSYTIAPRKDKIWNQSAKMLVKMKYQEIYVRLTSTEEIKLSARVFDAEDADETCTSATDYNFNDHTLNKGNRWYRINVADIRRAEQEIQIVYTASKECELNSKISADCPSTGLTGDAAVIPAGGSYTHVISRALIQNLSDSILYLKVENYENVSVVTNLVNNKPATPTEFNGAEQGALLQYEKVTAAGRTFVIALSELKGKKLQPEIAFINDSNKTSAVDVTVEIAFSNTNSTSLSTYNVIAKNISVAAGETGIMDFEKNIIDGLDEQTAAYVYVRIVPTQDIQVYARLKHIHEGNACKNSQDIAWNATTYQEGETTVWYAIDLTEAKDATNPQDITVTVTNRADAKATIAADLAFECPYTDLQSITRSLNAYASTTKKLTYSSFAMMSSDVVYIGVTTNQPIKIDVEMTPVEKKTPEDACLNAVVFDWTYGHSQDADTAVWYKVGMNDIRNSNLIPEVVINNRGNKSITINGELSIDCPDSIANEVRSITFGANGTYTKQVARDLFKNISVDTVYIKLSANQPFAFRVNQVKEDEGASCASAILFNWVSGNDQDANTTLWYMIDLKEVKAATGKQVRALIKNYDRNNASTLSADLAATCPCETPQSQSRTLAAGAVKERVLPRSTFETFGDTLYFRVSTTTNIHFEAHLEDAEPFDTIYACNEATEVLMGTTYTRTADTAWYYFLTDTIRNEQVLTPQVEINNGAEAQSIKAFVTYTCPVTEEMMNRTQSFTANQTMKKTIERSMAQQIASHDTVYVMVVGAKDYSFTITMVDPNTGNDCMHAVEIVPDVTFHTQAGVETWYKLNVGLYGSAAYADYKARFVLGNEDGVAGRVVANVYNACEGELLQNGSATLAANGVRAKSVMCEQLSGLSNDYIYLQITTAQQDSLLMQIIEREPIDTIYACADAIPFAINTDYYQAAGDTVWYVVNVPEMRDNTQGDATLTINNFGNTDNKVKAEMSWVCPVSHEMTSKILTVAPMGTYTRVFDRSNLSVADGHDLAYVRVISPDTMHFRVDMALAKGDECTNPIEFDWVNGNTNPKGECLWYNVTMRKDTVINGIDSTTLIVPEGMDLRLYIQNLSDSVVTASASMWYECLDKKPMVEPTTYTFKAGETKHKDIDRDLLEPADPTSILVHFCSPASAMRIWAKFVPEAADSVCYKDIRLTHLCNGDTYTDPYGKKTITIDVEDSTTLVWSDTVSVRVGTIMVDSIYRFTVVPKETATAIKYENVPDSVKVLAVQGMKLDYSRLENYLIDYYTELTTSADSLADYDYSGIYWEAYDDANGMFRPVTASSLSFLNDTLPATLNHIRLAYAVGTECGDNIVDTFTVDVEPWLTVTQNAVAYECAGTTFTWRGKQYTATTDTTFADSLLNIKVAVDTFKMSTSRQMDSIFTYRVVVKQVPALPTETEVVIDPAMTYHSSINMSAYTTLVENFFTANYSGDAYSQVTSVVWERKNLTDGSYAELQAGVNDTIIKDDEVVLRYVVTTECDDVVYSTDLSFTPATDCAEFDLTTFTIDWGHAFCGRVYNSDAVKEQIALQFAAEGVSVDMVEIYYSFDGNNFAAYAADTMKATESEVYFYAVATNDCGNMSQSNTSAALPIEAPDMRYSTEFTNLPAEAKYGNWLLMIDLNMIKANFGINPAEEEVKWYIMTGSEPDPFGADVDTEKRGYYFTADSTLTNNYYAVIDMTELEQEEGECGGVWRTTVITLKAAAPARSTRKQMLNGKLYIITDDNQMYDAQGQKVEQ